MVDGGWRERNSEWLSSFGLLNCNGWVLGGELEIALGCDICIAADSAKFGDPIDATQALNWGLITESVASSKLNSRAHEIAATIAVRAPIAAECAKSNLKAAFSMAREDAIKYERDLQVISLATEDANEGRLAFKEKRAANFKKR